jgi:hypothetical protein
MVGPQSALVINRGLSPIIARILEPRCGVKIVQNSDLLHALYKRSPNLFFHLRSRGLMRGTNFSQNAFRLSATL